MYRRNLPQSPLATPRPESSRGTTPGPDEIVEDDLLRREKEAHDALIADGGRLCHPPDDSKFGILDNCQTERMLNCLILLSRL
jgi:hypothetical protein